MIKATLMRTITTVMTSPKLRQTARKTRAMVRQLKGARPVVHYFHEAADPYSHLTAQALEQFAAADLSLQRRVEDVEPWSTGG